MSNYSYGKGELNMTKTIETDHRASYSELFIDGKPGLQIGKGSISYKGQLETGELDINNAEAAKRYLMSDEAYSIIEKEDDTCVDGRISVLTTKKMQDGSVIETDISYIRPKVPGGGQHMVSIGMIGLGIIEENAQAQAHTAISFLLSHNIKFGAHTDTIAIGDSCGCGAIDKFPLIANNVVRYQSQISEVMSELYKQILEQDIDKVLLENVFSEYRVITENTFFEHYSGNDISLAIKDSGAVVKKLSDKHKEGFIVINLVTDTTLNQKSFVQKTNNGVQAFCVDIWRMKQLSVALGSNNEKDELLSFYSMLAYGIATFMTLTDGTLPIIVRSK